MATSGITQRNDGRWCGTLQVNGKRRFVYGTTEREAKRKLDELRRQAITNGALAHCGTKTVNDLIDAWLATVRPSLKARSLQEYEKVADLHIRPTIGRIRLTRIEPSHLQDLVTRLQTKGLRRQPVYVHTALHRAFKFAVMWGWLPANPVDRVLRPRYKAPRRDVWSPEELRAFLDGTADHWLNPLWVVAAATGARIGELLALRWTDVDLNTATITIKRSLQKVRGEWVEGTPKTRSGERTIQIPREGVEALRAQRVQQAEQRLRAGVQWQDLGLVFSGLKGQPLQQCVALANLKKESDRLHLPAITLHTLRHTHASLLLAQNLPITAVSSRLGHSNPAITMAVYAHSIKRQDEEAARVIGDLLQASR